MHIERVNSAYRLGVVIALLYAFWTVFPVMFPHVRTYIDVVAHSARRSQMAPATRDGKLSAAKLEAALNQGKQFGPSPDFQCIPAARDWDYVCSYMTTPLQSRKRLQFGVRVDATRSVMISSIAPMGTVVPPPH
jgi:hypothetical protein